MKKIILPLFCAAAAVMLAGCVQTSTVTWSPAIPGQKSSDGHKAVWNLHARNCGLYLFYYIPIWSGKVTRPNRGDYEIFKDNVNEWGMYRLLDSRLAMLDASRVEDVKFKSHSSGMLGLWIFWKRSMIADAVAVVPGGKSKKNSIETKE